MHETLAEIYLDSIRRRHAQGDNPTEPSIASEQLEFLALHLADRIRSLQTPDIFTSTTIRVNDNE